MPVFSLGLQPLANDFCRDGEDRCGYVPLEVLFCPNCTLGQLSAVVRPDILYKKYSYATSRSATMRRHFESLLSYIRSECEPVSLVEVGSNDGYFLGFAKQNGSEIVCGVDPSENRSQEARDAGVQTITGLFCEKTAEMARGCVPMADCIVARHVFGHVDDMRGFIKALDVVANKNTLILIEVPWARRLLERCEFDTVYHEHLSYITIKSMAALLENTPFRLHKIHEFPVHGGALGIMIRRRDHDSSPDPIVQSMISMEVVGKTEWDLMSECAARVVDGLVSRVRNAIASGKTVAGYGASAKMTVLMNACGFTRKEIQFVTDTTPQKQLCCIPGTDIPVAEPSMLLSESPDFCILGAWNYISEILEKESLYRKNGGVFINPHESNVVL